MNHVTKALLALALCAFAAASFAGQENRTPTGGKGGKDPYAEQQQQQAEQQAKQQEQDAQQQGDDQGDEGQQRSGDEQPE